MTWWKAVERQSPVTICPLAIQLLKRATEVDPKNKYAWYAMALAYMGMRQNDDAIAALKKQIEINPYDEYAYNALGRAYWQERKYDDAVTAFNKQIEINPSTSSLTPALAPCIPSGTSTTWPPPSWRKPHLSLRTTRTASQPRRRLPQPRPG